MIAPRWDGSRWIIQPQRDGKRYTFTSSTPGSTGKREVKQRYEAWLFNEGSTGQKTVGQVASEYLEDVKARRGVNAECYIQSERYIRLYIAPKCASRKMCKMTLRDWQNVINGAVGVKGGELSHKTLTNLRATIMALIKFGYSDYQNDLPRGELYIPLGHSREEKEILQPADIRRLFEPSDLFYHPLFCFLALTGMRPGEALGLQLRDIDFEHSCVHIRRAVNAKGIVTPGKNENARRMIPIGSIASDILRKTIARNEKLNLGTVWIFCDIHGGPGKQTTMRNHWLILKKERDLPGSVYSLRHTFISLVKNSLPESTIKSIVGHSVSMRTIGGTYDHIVDGETKKAADVIDLTFGQLSQDKKDAF